MSYKLQSLVAATLAGSLMLSVGTNAMADSTDELVGALVAKGVLTDEEGALLMKGRASEKEAAEKKARSNPTLEVGKKGLVVKGADGDFSIKLGGRMHADYSSHSGDESLKGGKEAVDGTEIRRGRIALSGTVYNDFDYMIETDFGGDKVSIKDLFMVYHGFNAPMELTVGHQKHAMSMEVQESSNDIMFTERSLVTALTLPYFDRAIGVNMKGYGKDWHVNAGLYGDSMANGASNKDEGHGFGVRGTYALINEADKVLHVGANYGYRKVSEDNLANGKTTEFSYKTTNLSSLKLVDAKFTNMDDVKTGIVELAAMYGPLSFQSEYAKSTVSRTTGSDVDFDAFYAQVGYTLTGESRTYKGSDGEFKRLVPKSKFSLKNGTWGAWEVAARYDQADLEDDNVTGGEQKRMSVSLNWYLNEDVRLLAGYTKAFELDGGALTKADGKYADDIDVYTVRAQWAF
ncbi:MAG: porin [Methylotenera sp.]|uniref:OprO/OprP family phosphate-selective porin n=1 Tax=Methylotenera sp. TaxID=2051956 RepID=UPI0024891517|nr:porin [Methylotenera sp.]MDI1308307.1 porin [Methylotenera sp.]